MQKKNDINYADVLIPYRKRAGLTQQQVADALNIKRPTYAKYEKDVTPPLDILFKLSQLLKFPIELLDISQSKEKAEENSVNYLEIYRKQAKNHKELKVASDAKDIDLSKYIPSYLKDLDKPDIFLPTESEKQFILMLRKLDSKKKESILKTIKEYIKEDK